MNNKYSSKWLISEPPLMMYPTLAKAIGVNEAIVLQQIHYWLQCKPKEAEGRAWIYNTYKNWHEQFPFWSERTIKRIVKNLIERGLITTANFNKFKIDRTLWYSINYEKLDEIITNSDTTKCHYDSVKLSPEECQVNTLRECQVVTTNNQIITDNNNRYILPSVSSLKNSETSPTGEEFLNSNKNHIPIIESGNCSELNNSFEENNNVDSFQVGSKATKEKISNLKLQEDIETKFEWFYKEYPRKVSKAKTRDWFVKNKPCDELMGNIAYGLKKYKEDNEKTDKQYIKHPITWLNQRIWEDYL